jgi:hypothetical protein
MTRDSLCTNKIKVVFGVMQPIMHKVLIFV